MPVKPKQRHLARAPQEYYDLRARFAQQGVHLKAICHRYDIEIAEQFPERSLVYALADQIAEEQRAYVRTNRELRDVSSKLKFSGNFEEDKKTEQERATINYTVRKLHWGDRQGETVYPSPPNTPSPPPSPPSTLNQTDIWTTFRDSASAVVDEDDSPKKSGKKVHFSTSLNEPRCTKLRRLKTKVGDVARSVARTPLLHSILTPPSAATARRSTSSPKKRACVDDDYTEDSHLSPPKRLKKRHATPWPEAYSFEDLESSGICEDVRENTRENMRPAKVKGNSTEQGKHARILPLMETMTSPTTAVEDVERGKLAHLCGLGIVS